MAVLVCPPQDIWYQRAMELVKHVAPLAKILDEAGIGPINGFDIYNPDRLDNLLRFKLVDGRDGLVSLQTGQLGMLNSGILGGAAVSARRFLNEIPGFLLCCSVKEPLPVSATSDAAFRQACSAGVGAIPVWATARALEVGTTWPTEVRTARAKFYEQYAFCFHGHPEAERLGAHLR